MVKVAMKPRANNIGVLNRSDPCQIVPSQLKIFTPVGTAMSIVEIMKKICSVSSTPATNMWCTNTENERKPIATLEYAIIL